jgi:hypothetical protein
MESIRSPEALRIYFRGPAPRRFLERSDITVRETRVVEAAIATAGSAAPDLETMREAERLIRLHREEYPPSGPRSGREERPDFAESEMARYSSLRNRPTYDAAGDPRTLRGYLYDNFKRRTIYAPIVIFALFFLFWFLYDHLPGFREEVESSDALFFNITHYPLAHYKCKAKGKRLPRTPEELSRRVMAWDEGKARIGYWLDGGRVYLPLEDRIIVPPDEMMRWYICIGKEK